MQTELANLVQSILQHGIRLKRRLVQGEKLVLEHEQAVLKRMLLSDAEARRWPEYGGEIASDPSFGGPRNDGTPNYLGIRYALVCWLDELFLLDSPWDTQWNENKLEMALYGTNDRAYRFWEQAQLAESRPGGESLHSFFLSVILGFRGDLRESPAQLQAWVDNCRRKLTAQDRLTWTPPPEMDVATRVPPLRGREALQRMVYNSGTFLLFLLPVVVLVLLLLFQKPTAPTPDFKPKAGGTAKVSDSERTSDRVDFPEDKGP